MEDITIYKDDWYTVSVDPRDNTIYLEQAFSEGVCFSVSDLDAIINALQKAKEIIG